MYLFCLTLYAESATTGVPGIFISGAARKVFYRFAFI
jgi:hypothetical protein